MHGIRFSPSSSLVSDPAQAGEEALHWFSTI
jgi:hypothetical protein